MWAIVRGVCVGEVDCREVLDMAVLVRRFVGGVTIVRIATPTDVIERVVCGGA